MIDRFALQTNQITMKKLFLSVVASIAMIVSTIAQDYKPAGGEKNLEVQFAPLGGNPISIGGLRFRSFMTDKTAVRATVFLGYNSSSNITQQEDGTTGAKELKSSNSGLTINLRPGYEMHFEGTDRLSPYVGGEVDIAIATSSDVTEVQVETEVYENTVKGQSGFTRFGLNAIAGVDYYVAKRLYLGTEMGFGFALTSNSTIKTETTIPGAPNIADQNQGSSLNIGPNVLGQIRLGYLF